MGRIYLFEPDDVDKQQGEGRLLNEAYALGVDELLQLL